MNTIYRLSYWDSSDYCTHIAFYATSIEKYEELCIELYNSLVDIKEYMQMRDNYRYSISDHDDDIAAKYQNKYKYTLGKLIEYYDYWIGSEKIRDAEYYIGIWKGCMTAIQLDSLNGGHYDQDGD